MKQVTWPYVDTALSPAGSHGITIPVPNFAEDFRTKSDGTDSIVLTNLTTPLGYSETVRYGHMNVTDMYAGTGIDKSLWAPSKRGSGILVSDHVVAKATDSTDPLYEVALPFRINTSVQFLQHELVTADLIVDLIARQVALWYNTLDTAMKPRVNALMRGVLKPDGI